MAELVEAVLRGLGTGSVYALLALGFVIIYKATRVISFAQPAFMLAGVTMVTYLVLEVSFWVAVPVRRVPCREVVDEPPVRGGAQAVQQARRRHGVRGDTLTRHDRATPVRGPDRGGEGVGGLVRPLRGQHHQQVRLGEPIQTFPHRERHAEVGRQPSGSIGARHQVERGQARRAGVPEHVRHLAETRGMHPIGHVDGDGGETAHG
jgi:hypothetical protein